jgi:hypothetical protein
MILVQQLKVLFINIISQLEVKNSIFEIFSNYFQLLMEGTSGGKLYLICIFLLILSYFFFKNYKFYFITLFVLYIFLFFYYFLSIHFYHEGILDWATVGHGTGLHFDEIYLSYLDTSVFFIIYNLIFVIILFFHKRTNHNGNK